MAAWYERCDVSTFGPPARVRQFMPMVMVSADRFGVPWSTVAGVIRVESNWNRSAVSGSAGARGLMQILPTTSAHLARQLGLPDAPFDPETNINLGTYYISKLLKRWNGDERLALASYWAGAGNVQKALSAGKLWPRMESYAAKVGHYRDAAQRAADACGLMTPVPGPTRPTYPTYTTTPHTPAPAAPRPAVAGGGGGLALVALAALAVWGMQS